jgi:ATP-binding cassette subfamily B protein
LINWLMMLATIGAVASWIGAVVFLYVTKRTGFEQLGAAAVAAPILVTRFATVGMAISQTLQASIFLDDLNDFLNLKQQTFSSTQTRARSTPKISEIKVDSVHFSYPGTEAEALKGVSLTLKPGEVVALVGENGSGKTTLAKIIGQLYRPSSGRVLVNGIDTEELDGAELRKQIAIIFQDFVRYQLTANENVALGDTAHIDDTQRVQSAVDQAGARDFLERLPEKYETILSKAFPGGADLSIGQWQRVALARAFFRDAPFIILDEPTAALDARAEYHLFERLRELRRGRTLLLISHRFSTVRSADHIFVMNQGEIIENGSHDELMQNEGLYAELFNLQTSVDLQPEADIGIQSPSSSS